MDIFEKLVNFKFGRVCLWQLAVWIGIIFSKQIHVQNRFPPGSEVPQQSCVLKKSLSYVALGVYKENRLMIQHSSAANRYFKTCRLVGNAQVMARRSQAQFRSSWTTGLRALRLA